MAHEEESGNLGFPSEWARRVLPDYGPDWQAAIDFGIDVSLLLENLALTPAERLARLQKVVEFHELLRRAPARLPQREGPDAFALSPPLPSPGRRRSPRPLPGRSWP
jgi:hypothetical protein